MTVSKLLLSPRALTENRRLSSAFWGTHANGPITKWLSGFTMVGNVITVEVEFKFFQSVGQIAGFGIRDWNPFIVIPEAG